MSEPETIDIEPVNRPTVAALPAIQHTDQLVRPAAPVNDIAVAFAEYQDLCRRLLDDTDFQKIGDRKFPKKSAWRKLSVAMGVTLEIVDRIHSRDNAGRIISSEFVVRATAPNGRFADGWGSCNVFERCCQQPCPKAKWNSHNCCPEDCSGRVHFSHAEHDVPATGETRAKNRAASDLFGMGEVSAEEIVGDGDPDAAQAMSRNRSSKPPQQQQPPPPADEPGPTDAQLRKLHAMLREAGIDDEGKKRLLGRYPTPKSSTKELTRGQVSKLIDTLSKDPETVRKAAMPLAGDQAS